jgi:hypothetical protein
VTARLLAEDYVGRGAPTSTGRIIEARIETDGDLGAVLDIEIDRLVGLLAGDEEQAVVKSAMIKFMGFGPATFVKLTATMYTTEDDRLRIRAIEVLGSAASPTPKPARS